MDGSYSWGRVGLFRKTQWMVQQAEYYLFVRKLLERDRETMGLLVEQYRLKAMGSQKVMQWQVP